MEETNEGCNGDFLCFIAVLATSPLLAVLCGALLRPGVFVAEAEGERRGGG